MTDIGIIGAGMIANLHAEAALAVGSNVLAVFDPRQDTAATFGEKHGCGVEKSMEALLSRDDIRGVVIAVPNDMHAELAIAALNAGKDVLLEKPMAISMQQCDEIIAAANDSGNILQMGFVCRYAPAAIRARELIQDNRIGNVHHVKATLIRHRGIPGLGGWFTTKARSGGGCLIDIGVHLIDLVMHMTGLENPHSALGKCKQTFSIENYTYDEMWSEPVEGGTFDVEDGVLATVGFEGGATLRLDIAWATNLQEDQWQDGFIIDGDRGSMVVDLWGDSITISETLDGDSTESIETVKVEDAWPEAFQGEHAAFATAIESRVLQESAGCPEDGRLVQLIVESIYKSDSEQKEVAIAG
jgi:predicted dehydrogenase